MGKYIGDGNDDDDQQFHENSESSVNKQHDAENQKLKAKIPVTHRNLPPPVSGQRPGPLSSKGKIDVLDHESSNSASW